jgi:hypothetical protein
MSSEKQFLSFDEAAEIIRPIRLKTTKDWKRYCEGTFKGMKKPDKIPSDPDVRYKRKGWKSWSHFFGTNLKNYYK